MKSYKKALSIILSFVMLGACAPDSRNSNEGSVAKTTYEPPKPVIVEEDGYRIARGATRVQDMHVNFDSKNNSMSLRGKIEYLSTSGGVIEMRDVSLAGTLASGGYINLRTDRKDHPRTNDQVRIAAKATCLSEQGTCYSSFIDIYIYAEGIVYHHQIESQQDEPKADDSKNEDPKKEDPKKDEPKKDEPKKEDPKKEDSGVDAPKADDKKDQPPQAGDDDNLESEGGSDIIEGEIGQYVGSINEDIRNLLEVEAKKDDKKDEKKDDSKADAGKPIIPKSSQAIGPANAGRLENSIDMLKTEKEKAPTGFHIIRPERYSHFATNELSYIVEKMGIITKEEIPGYKLSVGDLSYAKGGKIGRHKSHQNGLDADVAFYFNNKSFQGYFASAVVIDKPHANWMLEPQWKLFKGVVQTQLIDRIFIHKVLKKSLCELAIKNGELKKGDTSGLAYETLRRLRPDVDHNNHFHLRVKCSSAQVRCRQMAEPPQGSGCF